MTTVGEHHVMSMNNHWPLWLDHGGLILSVDRRQLMPCCGAAVLALSNKYTKKKKKKKKKKNLIIRNVSRLSFGAVAW